MLLALAVSAAALLVLSAPVRAACGISGGGPPIECTSGAPWCWDGPAPDPAEAMPVNLTIGHFGDQGIGQASRDVMQMMLGEGVEAIIHAGDFSYNCKGDDWMNNVEAVLGNNFPYFAAGGNHE
jgi:hypothetical protein